MAQWLRVVTGLTKVPVQFSESRVQSLTAPASGKLAPSARQWELALICIHYYHRHMNVHTVNIKFYFHVNIKVKQASRIETQ